MRFLVLVTSIIISCSTIEVPIENICPEIIDPMDRLAIYEEDYSIRCSQFPEFEKENTKQIENEMDYYDLYWDMKRYTRYMEKEDKRIRDYNLQKLRDKNE